MYLRGAGFIETPPGEPVEAEPAGPLERWEVEAMERGLAVLEEHERSRPERRAIAVLEIHERAKRCEIAEREAAALRAETERARAVEAEARAEIDRLRVSGWEAVLDANREMRDANRKLRARLENTLGARFRRLVRRLMASGR